MNEPMDEFWNCKPLRRAEIETFVNYGVPPLALVQPDVLMRDVVVFDGGGHFEFKRWEDGEACAAFIFLVRDAAGSCIDLVAWAATSGHAATWLGASAMLGEDWLAGYRLERALTVHSSPLDWLRASRRGVVIVDERKAVPALQSAGPLTVRGWSLAKRLRTLLAPPSITVDNGAEVRRA